jgi:hemerythrin
LKWKDEYATDVEKIDNQHKMIFKMSEDFRGALDDGAGGAVYAGLLESLQIYCEGHFGFEEKCMDNYHCPVANENKAAHALFLTVLNQFAERYGKAGFQRTDAFELIDLIDSWLSEHICRIDIHLKNCVKD